MDTLHLSVSTPSRVLIDAPDVVSLQAFDASGSFGIQPGHADFLTVIPASVVGWSQSDGKWRYCAVRGGVLSVLDGRQIAIACREGVLGSDLTSLETNVRAEGRAIREADQRARVEETRLHAHAVRKLVESLTPHSRHAAFARREEADV